MPGQPLLRWTGTGMGRWELLYPGGGEAPLSLAGGGGAGGEEGEAEVDDGEEVGVAEAEGGEAGVGEVVARLLHPAPRPYRHLRLDLVMVSLKDMA